MTQADLARTARGFEAFRSAAGFGAIRNENDYDRALALVESIMDVTRNTPAREDAEHPLSAMLDLLVPAIREYEAAYQQVPDASPAEVLCFLMEQHGLNQSQVPEVGNQSVVSQVLAGKRALNVRQIARLCERFGVGAEAFMR